MTHEDDIEDDFYASGNVRDYEDVQEGSYGTSIELPNGFSALSDEDKLKLARQILLEDLIKSVAAGHASPQEKNTLRQMLKDNGMIMGDPFEAAEGVSTGGSQKAKPKADLPTFDAPEYVQ